MSNLIAIVGDSGTGKSTSITNLDASETFVINVAGKPLPIRGHKKKYTSFAEDKTKGNYVETSKADMIGKVLAFIDSKRPDIKNVIIDDAQYLTAFELLDRALEKGWDENLSLSI